MEECRKICGGHGVLLASGIGPMALDYVTYNTAEGDMIVLELQAARFLLKQLKTAQQESLTGTLEFLNDHHSLPDMSFSHLKTADDFVRLDSLKALLRARVLHTVLETSAQLDALLGGDKALPFDQAWNACALDLVRCSRTNCYYTMLCNFAQAIESCENQKVRAALEKVCQLYALVNVSEDLGSFDFTVAQKRAVRQAVLRLLPLIRRDCIALTDAFEFSDNILNSAIGRYDGKVYEAIMDSARNSPLNFPKGEPFKGYKEHLRPILDIDFIAENKLKQRAGSATSKL
jgi:hypothetical protein